MKKSISILFCLFMFPLFLNTSQVNAQSSVPSCLSFKSGDHAARIECFKKNEKEFRARIKSCEQNIILNKSTMTVLEKVAHLKHQEIMLQDSSVLKIMTTHIKLL